MPPARNGPNSPSHPSANKINTSPAGSRAPQNCWRDSHTGAWYALAESECRVIIRAEVRVRVMFRHRVRVRVRVRVGRRQ